MYHIDLTKILYIHVYCKVLYCHFHYLLVYNWRAGIPLSKLLCCYCSSVTHQMNFSCVIQDVCPLWHTSERVTEWKSHLKMKKIRLSFAILNLLIPFIPPWQQNPHLQISQPHWPIAPTALLWKCLWNNSHCLRKWIRDCVPFEHWAKPCRAIIWPVWMCGANRLCCFGQRICLIAK